MTAVETSADATALLARWQTGDIEACRQLTRHLQPETFDLALMLTGDPKQAADLASAAIISILNDRRASQGEPRLDMLEALITLARQQQVPFGRLASAPTEDERTRIHAALSMASPTARAMIGMTRLLGFAPSTATMLLDNPGSGTEQQVEIVERRLHEAAGSHSAAQLYLALSRYVSSFSRPDLWSTIEPQVQRRRERCQRRRRIRNLALIGVVAITAIACLYWIIGPRWGASETPEPQMAVADQSNAELAQREPLSAAMPASTVAIPDPPVVPDTELVIAPNGPDSRQTNFYRLDGGQPVELGAGSDLLIARDASWFVLREPLPDSTERFTAVDTATLASRWSITTPAPSAATLTSTTLVLLQGDGDGGYRLDRYLAEDGSRLPEIPIPDAAEDRDGSRLSQVVPNQDGDRVYVLIGTSRYQENIWTMALTTIDATTGEIVGTQKRESGPGSIMRRDFSVTGARMTVDGSALYSMVRFDNRDRVGVQFLDLESGSLSSLSLPFPRRTDSALVDVQAIPSNSGRLLYVVSTLERQVAVIDLVERQLSGIYPIEPGNVRSSDYFASFRRAAYVLGDISPDGKLLYLGLIALNNSRSPIWAIDTSNWQAVRGIQTSGKPFGMHLSADGNTLWLQLTSESATQLSKLDLDSGEEQPVPLPDTMGESDLWLTSLHGFYRWQYGRTPATKAVNPVDNEQIAMLPTARITSGPVTAGIPREITIQMIDPLTGDPLTEQIDDVRFDPDAQMTLTLQHESGATTLLIPYLSTPGEYRGTVMLDRSGQWTLSAHFTSLNGGTWDVAQLGKLNALPGLVGDDGRAYLFDARPETLISGRTVTVFGWVVSASSGARLRDDTALESGFPRIIRLELLGPGLRQRIVLLQRVGHARYLGWVRLDEPGTWRAIATVARDHDDPVEIELRDWQIHELGTRASSP